MFEFIIFVLIVVNVWHAWRAIRQHQRMTQFRNELADNLAQIEEHLVENYINMKLEKHNGIYYFYDMKDDTFICQGKTKQEIYCEILI